MEAFVPSDQKAIKIAYEETIMEAIRITNKTPY